MQTILAINIQDIVVVALHMVGLAATLIGILEVVLAEDVTHVNMKGRQLVQVVIVHTVVDPYSMLHVQHWENNAYTIEN